MKPSKMILASIFLSAIILIVVGGVTATAMANKSAAATAGMISAQDAQAREQQYQQLLQQANQQLEKANTELQAMQSKLAQYQPPAAAGQTQSAVAPTTANVQVKVTADQASAAAKQAADPSAVLQKKAELVNYQGQTVYEVVFDKGPVYIDANTGQVLFNGTVPQVIDAKTAAQTASQYLGLSDVLQTDKIQFRGQQVYRVIFKNGTIAFLDMSGQIFYVIPYNPNAGSNLLASGSGGGGGGGGGGGYHESEGGGGHDN